MSDETTITEPPLPNASERRVWAAFRAALPNTFPVLAGYWFLGFAYGFYMHISGFSVWYPLVMSMTIFGGSLEFVAVTMLLAPFAPLQTFVLAFLIQARHLFYGVAMLDRFKGAGWMKPYLIFGMTDETFALNCSTEPPKGLDSHWFMFWVTILNHFYWVSGSVLGALLGKVLDFDAKGLEFVLTAMFVSIFCDRLLKEKRPYTGLIGLGATIGCRLIFGPNSFMLAAMGCIFVLLTVLRKPLERNAIE